MRSLLKRAKVFNVAFPVEPHLEVTRFLSEWSRRYATEPTVLFTRVTGFPRSRILMNVFRRALVLPSLGLPARRYLAEARQRLEETAGSVTSGASVATERLDGLDDLPILTHQPGDSGRYLTSFVSCLVDPATGVRNLGFYRAQVRDSRTAVIFMDPRTDGSRIVRETLAAGAPDVPITLFAGGPVATYLSGAAATAADEDSYVFASRLAASPIALDATAYPPAPSEAEVVIHARVLRERGREAPFGEFKGYYCEPTDSPLIQVDEVFVRPDYYYLGLFCGKESGLELMSLTNELLMYRHLRSLGFAIGDVRYPLDAFGEFLTAIEAPFERAAEVVDAAMRFDRRTKMVVAGPDLADLGRKLSIFDFDSHTAPYVKRGTEHGTRLGLALRPTSDYRWVEY